MEIALSNIEYLINSYNPYEDLLEFRNEEFFENKFIEYLNDFRGQVEKLKEELNHKFDEKIDKELEKIIRQRNDEEIDRIFSGYYSVLTSNKTKIALLKNSVRKIKNIILVSETADIKRMQKIDSQMGEVIDNGSALLGITENIHCYGTNVNDLLDSFNPSSVSEFEKQSISLKSMAIKMCDEYRENFSIDTATKYINNLNSKVDKLLDSYADKLGCLKAFEKSMDEIVTSYKNYYFWNYYDWVSRFKLEISDMEEKFKKLYSSKMADKFIRLLEDKTGEVIDDRAEYFNYPSIHEKEFQKLLETYKPSELDIFDVVFYKNEEERNKAYEKYKLMTPEEKNVFEMRIYEQYIRNFKAKIREFNRDIRGAYSSKRANKMVDSINKRADKLIREKAKEIGKPVPRNPWFIRKYLWMDTENFMTEKGLAFRKFINPFMRGLVKVAMKNKYIIEERPKLDPTKQYVFVSTHYFTEDIISLYSSLGKQAYMLMGTTDQIENNFLMLAAIMMGLFYVDREDKVSRKECVDKQNKIIELGSNVVNYVGGSWENSENELQPLSFSGPYKTSVAKDVQIVPVAFYLVREEKKIYVRYGEPMDLSMYDEKRANEIIRDTLASMHYKQIEKHSIPIEDIEIEGYGKTHNLPYDQHTYYMDQIGNEYWNQYWSKPFAKEEIGLRPKKVVDEADVYSFVDNLSRENLIRLSKQLSEPMLRRYERDERYNIVKYIDENYERFKENNSGIKTRKRTRNNVKGK